MSEQKSEKAELPANATIEQKLDHYFMAGKNPKFKQLAWPTFAEHFPELAAKLLKKDETGMKDVPNADKDENGRSKHTITEHGKRFGVNMREDDVYGRMYSIWMMDAAGTGISGTKQFKIYRLRDINSGTTLELRTFLREHPDETWKYKESHYVPEIKDMMSVIVREEPIN